MASDLEYSQFVGRPIRVNLDTGGGKKNEYTSGNLVTYDPITGTIVLAKFNGQNIKTFELLPKYSIKNIEELENIDENCREYSDEIQQLFDNYLGVGCTEIQESDEVLYKRASKVIDYLKSHHIEVVEKANGVYQIGGAVKFEKPYTRDNFYCDIPLVLQRILKLIDRIDVQKE